MGIGFLRDGMGCVIGKRPRDGPIYNPGSYMSFKFGRRRKTLETVRAFVIRHSMLLCSMSSLFLFHNFFFFVETFSIFWFRGFSKIGYFGKSPIIIDNLITTQFVNFTTVAFYLFWKAFRCLPWLWQGYLVFMTNNFGFKIFVVPSQSKLLMSLATVTLKTL